MSGLFSKPKAPEVQAAPETPIVNQATVDRQTADIAQRRRGRAASDLTSSSATGAGTSGAVATKQLLGS
jgi:hypothetical protein